MGLFNFLKTRKPQGYSYSPVYYDPENENKIARRKEIERRVKNDELDYSNLEDSTKKSRMNFKSKYTFLKEQKDIRENIFHRQTRYHKNLSKVIFLTIAVFAIIYIIYFYNI